MSDSLPEWTLSLTDAVWKARTLTDMGIWPLRRIKLIGRCSWHGRQELLIETTEILDDHVTDGYVKCEPCDVQGVTRWLPIQEFLLLPEGK